MNRVMQEQWPMFEAMRTLRIELLDALTDADLAFNPGGQNMTMGALCREMGEISHAYIQSLKTFQQDWSYRNTEPGLENSKAKLTAWFDALDDDLKATLSAFSDEDFATKTVDRSGYPMPLEMQLGAYLQALLISFGKTTIFLRAMDKPLPKNMKEWIW